MITPKVGIVCRAAINDICEVKWEDGSQTEVKTNLLTDNQAPLNTRLSGIRKQVFRDLYDPENRFNVGDMIIARDKGLGLVTLLKSDRCEVMWSAGQKEWGDDARLKLFEPAPGHL